ncbi:bile salt-activated lipase-like [Epargyreus clarus]|uniref:bile salt-activated lipase-like n=1 Tax=Epargyreus clarus TaxID=520877 RepID=UPI003C2D0FC0
MKWLALLSLIAANVVKVPSPVVRTESGLVRGRISDNGRFHQYFGIPYGTVNQENRFKAPLPPPKWDGVFEAVDVNTRCPQKMMGLVVGDENCLKLHIYTPRPIRKKLLPVMVFIHGGGFYEGTGSPFLYGGDYFAENGVVFVGINYRLNAEGFLCLGIKEAPGNAGLKDQLAALKWIQRNIRGFGGDPDNVTLFGESAGAVSTSFLILSPSARGLFHKVILQSGATIAPWAIQHDPITRASKLAKEFGYNTTDPYKIYKILSKHSYDELISSIKYTKHKNHITADVLFVPCVEKYIPGVEPIVTEYPINIILSGNYTKLPMIIGFNDNEGIYFAAKNFGTSVRRVNTAELLQADLEFPTDEDKNIIVDTIRGHYFSSGKDEMIMDMVDLYSDLHFKFPTVIESEMYAKTNHQPIYYYLFKYSGTFNMPKMISLMLTAKGASHADELFYMFKPHSIPLPQRYMENHMIQKMVTLWTNFAKYTDPTPRTSKLLPVRWRPSREWNPVALVIDKQLTTGRMWDETSVRLWNNTYTKYRRKSYGFH